MVNIDKNSKTYKNLLTAFSGESSARVRYEFFSSQAKKDGLVHISNVFMDASNNEKEHAHIWFKLIHDGSNPSTPNALKEAISNEQEEWKNMYVRFEQEAKQEGYNEIAELFSGVAKVEKFHEERYSKLLKTLENNTSFVDKKEVYWFCLNCGSLIKGKTAPEKCPVCSHPQAYFIKSQTTVID